MKLRRASLALALLVASPAFAGTVRGTIWPTTTDARRAQQAADANATERYGPFGMFSRPASKAAPAKPSKTASARPSAPGVASARAGSDHPRPTAKVRVPSPRRQPGLREAVVYVDSIPEKLERKLASQLQRDRSRPNYRIVQSHERFTPRVSAVAAGAQVEFQNLDKVWHNAFSVSRASRFDLGKYAPGRLDTVSFERSGVINLHCDIHPGEIGFVLVAPNHAYVRPDSLGRFTLPALPAGQYTLHLWHPVLGERQRRFTVPKRGDVDLHLAF